MISVISITPGSIVNKDFFIFKTGLIPKIEDLGTTDSHPLKSIA